MPLRSLTLAVALGVLGHAVDAGAYCRTTTTKPPAGYNPATDGCWTQGVPLKWHASRAPYAVGQGASVQVSLADATRVADQAFAAWNAIRCPGTPSIQAYDDGPTAFVPDGGSDCTTSAGCNPQGRDVIVFDDTEWPHQDPASILALTTVTYGVDDGTIFEAYTEVNTANGMKVTTQEPPAGGARDLQAILTHEAGHFFGIAHATDTRAVMYAYYTPGRTALTSDDTSAFCTIYPPAAPSGCGCKAAGGAGSLGGGAGVLVGGAGLGLALRVRRRRRARH